MKRKLPRIGWLRRFVEMHGLLILRLSVGIIFFWFGLLKFFPGNAAESLAVETIAWLTAGFFDGAPALYGLGAIECAIGLALLSKKALHVAVVLMYIQLIGTIMPLFIFPDKTWTVPFMPSLTGQYIIKNIVFIASAIILGAVARGSKLITHPQLAQKAKKEEKEILQKAKK